MRFESPLIPATLVRRYKRFLADVILPDGREVTAHCANSGAMSGCAAPGSPVWLSENANPKAKLDYRWEIVETGGALVGINTTRPNAIAAEAIAQGRMAELAGYDTLRREVRYGTNSRVDLLLEGGGRPACYVEVKNVTLKRGAAALFPDAVTARGTKHLRELTAMVKAGHRAAMLYLVNRGDCSQCGVAADIDPAYAQALEAALAAGVQAYAYACRVTPAEIVLSRPLPFAALATYPEEAGRNARQG